MEHPESNTSRGLKSKAAVLTTSVGVGIVATILDWLVLLLAVKIGVPQRWAIIPACLVGVVAQFLGNQRLTFNAHRNAIGAVLGKQIWRFAVVETGTLILNYAVYNGLREWARADYRLSRVSAGFAVYSLFSLPLWHWVFCKDNPSAEVTTARETERQSGGMSG